MVVHQVERVSGPWEEADAEAVARAGGGTVGGGSALHSVGTERAAGAARTPRASVTALGAAAVAK